METTEKEISAAHKTRHPLLSGRRRAAAIAIAAAMLSAGGYYWNYYSHREYTDDAMIEAHVLPISSKVAGQAQTVSVDDNQSVEKGDLLVQIDPRDYQVKLDEAKAELAAAEADARRAAVDARRYEQLYRRDQVSKQVYDKAVADADVLRARTELARKKVSAAELDLSYTRITAPAAGQVAKKSVELRSFVQVGQPLMAVVPGEVWVTANFKETQLERVRVGQPVEIHVDTYPGHVFKGHVDSIQSGTGARFSLLPPENATGNFVKVVQRVPVKIVFDEPTAAYRLVPGMSVTPAVKIS
ncbi:MAG: HlyD family secretion protein [Elusimicrobiales bacterium]|nr:HlyD family secretion protein [Elusimicrobiales bacterium]